MAYLSQHEHPLTANANASVIQGTREAVKRVMRSISTTLHNPHYIDEQRGCTPISSSWSPLNRDVPGVKDKENDSLSRGDPFAAVQACRGGHHALDTEPRPRLFRHKRSFEEDAKLYSCAMDFTDIEAVSDKIERCSRRNQRRTTSLSSHKAAMAAGSTPSDAAAAAAAQACQPDECASTPSSTHPRGALGEYLNLTPIAVDELCEIEVYSAPIASYPMRLMCARAVMPCRPAELLRYMSDDIRPLWDTYVQRSFLVQPLNPPAYEATVRRAAPLSASFRPSMSPTRTTTPGTSPHHPDDVAFADQDDSAGGVGQANMAQRDESPDSGHSTAVPVSAADAHRLSCLLSTRRAHAARRVSSLAAQALCQAARNRHPRAADRHVDTYRTHDASHSSEEDGAQDTFCFAPGQHRVAIHYMVIRSPILFMSDRDFELVVGEHITSDGATAYIKAFSTPLGYAMPLDVQQSRYVRALAYISAVVARALPRASRRGAADRVEGEAVDAAPITATPHETCVVYTMGLIHPMGFLPSNAADMVVTAQLSSIQQLQRFIRDNRITALRARTACNVHTPLVDVPCVRRRHCVLRPWLSFLYEDANDPICADEEDRSDDGTKKCTSCTSASTQRADSMQNRETTVMRDKRSTTHATSAEVGETANTEVFPPRESSKSVKQESTLLSKL